MECEEEAAPIGTVVSEGADIKSIGELSEEERIEILQIYQKE